jgi:carboxymethylenebutenolidase
MDNNFDIQTDIAAEDIDPRIYDLYDQYCHSDMDRREFLSRAAAITVIGGSGLAMAQALLPRYAKAQMVSFTDERIKATYVT